MNKAQAIKAIQQVLGSEAGIKDYKVPSSEDQRMLAREARKLASERKKVAEAAMTACRDKVLRENAEYQRLYQEYKTARDALENTPWPSYRFSAGVVALGMFFRVVAEADSLRELVQKVKASKDK